MQQIFILTILHRPNETVQHAIRAAKKDVGEKELKTVKNSAKRIVRLNVLKEDVSVQNHVIVVICFVPVDVLVRHKKTV